MRYTKMKCGARALFSTTIISAACLLSIIIFLSALSQEMPSSAAIGGLSRRFHQIYLNGDGWVSADEFPGFRFKEIDRDSDGLVTLDEARGKAPELQARTGAPMKPGDRRPYLANAVFGDFDNDGWEDLVVSMAQERIKKVMVSGAKE